MSEFSDLLYNMIQAKDIKIAALAQYCGLDRSGMYKIIRGSRLPASPELVHQIAGYLELSPSGTNDLLEAYQITSIGKAAYRKRKSVLDFFLYLFDFQDFTSAFSSVRISFNESALPDEPVIFLNGQTQVNNMVHLALTKEFDHSQGHIRMIVQPDYSFLFDVLTALGHDAISASEGKTLSIEHILCFDNTDSVMPGTDRDYNISCLKILWPLHVCFGNYFPYYYYDNVRSHFSSLSAMPYLILTNDRAIIFSSDFQQGILFRSPESLDYFSTVFSKQLAVSKMLTHPLNDNYVDPDNITTERVQESFLLGAEPCLRLLMNPAHVLRYINRDLPLWEDTAAQISSTLHYPPNPDDLDGSFFTFTRDGILHFMETGTASEIPEGFFHPFDLKDRVILIQRMYEHVLNGRYRMLTGAFSQFPLTAHFDVTDQIFALLFPDFNNKLHFLIVQETNLISSFRDFAKNAEEMGLLASEADTALFLESVLERYGD